MTDCCRICCDLSSVHLFIYIHSWICSEARKSGDCVLGARDDDDDDEMMVMVSRKIYCLSLSVIYHPFSIHILTPKFILQL